MSGAWGVGSRVRDLGSGVEGLGLGLRVEGQGSVRDYLGRGEDSAYDEEAVQVEEVFFRFRHVGHGATLDDGTRVFSLQDQHGHVLRSPGDERASTVHGERTRYWICPEIHARTTARAEQGQRVVSRASQTPTGAGSRVSGRVRREPAWRSQRAPVALHTLAVKNSVGRTPQRAGWGCV
jgi:hypothetical protein